MFRTQILVLLLIGISALNHLAYPNAAQPGIFNAGGETGFRPLFEEDSSFVKQIQMKTEHITIDLYPGYAVVYGQYEMFNHSDSNLTFKIGYPVNPIYGIESESHQDAKSINVDSLYHFQSKNNIVKTKSDENENKWYYWQQNFEPNTTTSIEVKFIVNTNDGRVRKGYIRRYYNAFIYLIESAATWKGEIEKGAVFVYLNDGLNTKKIMGIHPSTLKYNKEHNYLLYSFENKNPKPEDNLIITYGKRLEDFDFQKVLADVENKYDDLVQKAAMIPTAEMETVGFKDPFEIRKKSKIKSLPLLFGLLCFWVLVKLIRRTRLV